MSNLRKPRMIIQNSRFNIKNFLSRISDIESRISNHESQMIHLGFRSNLLIALCTLPLCHGAALSDNLISLSYFDFSALTIVSLAK